MKPECSPAAVLADRGGGLRDGGIRIHFNSGHPPVTLEAVDHLSAVLTPENSPVLFGCRTGICGTCLVRARSLSGGLPPPEADEAELLRLLAPGEPSARLACQLRPAGAVLLEPLEVAR